MNAPLLVGKRALITGASRGIGLGIARAFAKNGVSCILVGRDSQILDARLAELTPGNHKHLVGDVSSMDTWTAFEAENVTLR